MILEGTLEELKERDISKKSIEEKVAYAIEIKKFTRIKNIFQKHANWKVQEYK